MFKKIIIGILSGMTASLVLLFGLELLGLEWTKFFKPRRENIERKVFKQTKSYVEGKIQDLARYKAEYDKTEDQLDKSAIEQKIINEFANFDESKIEVISLQNYLIKTILLN